MFYRGALVDFRAFGRATHNQALDSAWALRAKRSASSSSSSSSPPIDHDGSDANGPNDNHPPRNRLNLSLVGPPGSGKGSYGKHFAEALKVPLVTTSDVLRKLRPDLLEQMANGELVEDAVVGETVLEGLLQRALESEKSGGYVLDGFPRTLEQVALTETTWPEAFRISTVIHLNVPDFVCRTKLLGRRACSGCGASYNVNGVDRDGWILPPHLPPKGHVCRAVSDPSPSTNRETEEGNTSCDWSVRREDDTPEIVGERLKVYHDHADPILDYVRRSTSDRGGVGRHRLLTLEPHHGFADLPVLIEKLHRHVG
jgi:adenylate kinase